MVTKWTWWRCSKQLTHEGLRLHMLTHAYTCLHSACRKMWMQPTSIKCSRKHGPRWTRAYNILQLFHHLHRSQSRLPKSGVGMTMQKNYLLIMQAHDHRWDSQILVKRWRENGSPIPTKSFLHPIQPTARPPISSGDTSCLLNAMKMVSFCCNVCSILFPLSGSYGSSLWLCLPCAWPKKTHCQSLSQNPKCVPFLVCNSHDSPWLTRSALMPWWLDDGIWRISVGHTKLVGNAATPSEMPTMLVWPKMAEPGPQLTAATDCYSTLFYKHLKVPDCINT